MHSENGKASILVVDDEKGIRITLAQFLDMAGYRADIAEDVQSALEMIKNGSYDVVISDVVLPGKSGVDLLRTLREAAPGIQIIMMTGEPTVHTAAEAVRQGACDYLSKPVGKDDILQSVARAVELKRLMDENEAYRDHLEELVELRSAEVVQSEHRLRTIVDHLQTGIFIVDVETRKITYVNPIAEKLIGLHRSEIMGKVCHNFVCVQDRGRCPIADLGQTVDNEVRGILTPDGRKIPVLKTVVPVDIEGRPCLLESFVDISSQKETERALREARDIASRTARGQSELLANVSHEFMTPLNGVVGMAQLLLDEALTPGQKEYVQTIYDSGMSLVRTLTQVAELSEVEMVDSTTCVPAVFSPRALIELAVDNAREAAANKGLALNCPQLPPADLHISGVQQYIRRILECLLDNAVKFTEQGSITVNGEVGDVREGCGQFRVTVEDTGPGISPELRADLFNAFAVQDSSTTRQQGGLGLGLALCRRLVQLMEGSLEVESPPGKGARFILTCPVTLSAIGE